MFILIGILLLASSNAQEISPHDSLFSDDFQIEASDAEGVDVGAFFSRFGLGRDLSETEQDPLAEMLEQNLNSGGPPNIARLLSFARSAPSSQIESIVKNFRERAERNPDDRIAKLVLKYGQPVIDNPETLKMMSDAVIVAGDEDDVSEGDALVMMGETIGYKGLKMLTATGLEYNSFLGVRYADPPTEEYRFQPPRLARSPSGIEDATKQPVLCPQYNVFNSSEIVGSEDCLFLNIFTPKLTDNTTSDGLPVIVFIHGGAFSQGGASTYRPDFLVQNDVVLVVIQYRLGSLGFLSNQDEVLTGNYAMYDQIMAFDWVKRNIRHFGGNPNDVILMGQSAGASCIHTHLVSPLSRGLFHAAITHSGTSLDQWAIQRDAKKFAARVASKVGCEAADSLALYRCLQKLPIEKLLLADKEVKEEDQAKGIYQYPGPVIQKPFDNRFLPVFMSEEPALSLRLGKTAKVPLIMGLTRDETVGYIGRYILAKNGNNQLVGRPLVSQLLKDQFKNLPDLFVDLMDHEFFDGQLAQGGVDLDVLLDASNDFSFRSAAYQSASLYSKSAPTYFYSFEYAADVSLSKVMNTFGFSDSYLGGSPKVEHGDDLPMIFPLRGAGQEVRIASESDVETSQMMVKMWTNFARFKNPTPSVMDPTAAVTWLPFSEDTPQYLKIARPTVMESKYRTRQMRFLNEVMPKLVLAAQLCAAPLSFPAPAPVGVDAVIVEPVFGERKLTPQPPTHAEVTSLALTMQSVPVIATEIPTDSVEGVEVTDADASTSSPDSSPESSEESSEEKDSVGSSRKESSTQSPTTAALFQIDAVVLNVPVEASGKSSQAQLETKPVISTANLPNSLDHISLAKQLSHSAPTDMYELMKLRNQQAEAQASDQSQTSITSATQSGSGFDLSLLAGFLPQGSSLEPVDVNPEDVDAVVKQLPEHYQVLARSFPADSLKSVFAGLKSSGQLGDLVANLG